MAIDYIENHSFLARARLVQQDKESYNVTALLSALVNPLQEIEDSLQDLIYKRSLLKAKGTILDDFGTIVGEERGFRKDTEYRHAVLARIFINKGGGTASELITAIKLLFQTKNIEVTNLYPACFSVFIEQDVGELIGIKQVISSISPLGIGDFVVTANVSGSGLFEFSECASAEFNFVTDAQDQFQVIQNVGSGESGESGEREDLSVTSETVQEPKGAVGLSELSLCRYNLVIEGGIYVVDKDATELVMVTSKTNDSDYTAFWEGGELTEVIND